MHILIKKFPVEIYLALVWAGSRLWVPGEVSQHLLTDTFCLKRGMAAVGREAAFGADEDGQFVCATTEFVGHYVHFDSSANAWKSAPSVVVVATDVSRFIQTSPLFQLLLPDGHTRRVNVRLSGQCSHRKHPLFHEVTDVVPRARSDHEGFANASLNPSPTPRAIALIASSPDVVLHAKRRACGCKAMEWVEEVTPRLLGRTPSRVRLKFVSVRPQHKPSCALSSPKLLAAERMAIRAVATTPGATPGTIISGTIPVPKTKRAEDAFPVIRNIPEYFRGSAAVSSALAKARLATRRGLGSFTAVASALFQSLDKAVADSKLNEYPVFSFRRGTTAAEGWSIFAEQENGREYYTELAPDFGIFVDDKVDVTHQDGVHITLMVVPCPKKPTVPLITKGGDKRTLVLNMARWQHTSYVCFAGLTTKSDNVYATANRECLQENLACTKPSCAHTTEIKPGSRSTGFSLWKPQCVVNAANGYPRVTHKSEGMDMCSATMTSFHQWRRKNDPSNGGIVLERLILCYYHSATAYAERAAAHLRIGASPTLMDRAQR